MLLLLSFLFACGEPVLNYKCTCTQIAYKARSNGQDIDNSFTENVCDTYENVQAAFADGGVIDEGLKTCEEELSALAGEDGYTCDCECTYQSECQ